MQPSPQAIADGRRWEGYSLTVYSDSKGLPTQGIGRHHGISFGDPAITDATAKVWFVEDWQGGYAGAKALFQGIDAIDTVRQEALIWLTFNMGVKTLSQFTPFIGHVNAGEWTSAHFHLLTNMRSHLTPYLLQTGTRAVETALRISSGSILSEFAI